MHGAGTVMRLRMVLRPPSSFISYIEIFHHKFRLLLPKIYMIHSLTITKNIQTK